MTRYKFFKKNGHYFGFIETGHAGYAEAGDDIVCSALSAMTMLVINAIEVSYASDVKYIIDEEKVKISVFCRSALPENEPDEKKQYAISGLFEAFFLQLNDMLEDYYEFIDVDEIEADPGSVIPD